jgi:hypothetical protein
MSVLADSTYMLPAGQIARAMQIAAVYHHCTVPFLLDADRPTATQPGRRCDMGT